MNEGVYSELVVTNVTQNKRSLNHEYYRASELELMPTVFRVIHEDLSPKLGVVGAANDSSPKSLIDPAS